MKIINVGRKNWDKEPRQFVCSRCDCVFEAEKGEYTARELEPNATEYIVNCPNCGLRIVKTVQHLRRERSI